MKFKFNDDYEVSVYAYFKVAMSKRTDREEIEEECFNALKDIYKNESSINVVDTQLMEFKQGKFFTIADAGLDLRIKVSEIDYEKAFEKAEGIAEDIKTPTGVAYYECEAYDYDVVANYGY